MAAFGLLVGISALTVRAADKADEAVKGKIKGTVVDKDGKAVEGAKVNFTKPQQRGAGGGGGGGAAQRPEPLATATTDKDGKFELTFDPAKVADGNYRVSTNVQDKGTARATVAIKDGKVEKAVELKLGTGGNRRGGGGGGGGQ